MSQDGLEDFIIRSDNEAVRYRGQDQVSTLYLFASISY